MTDLVEIAWEGIERAKPRGHFSPLAFPLHGRQEAIGDGDRERAVAEVEVCEVMEELIGVPMLSTPRHIQRADPDAERPSVASSSSSSAQCSSLPSRESNAALSR